MKTYSELSTRIATAMQKGLSSIDYQVASREMFILDESNVMATLVATETTRMNTGESKTSGRTIISIPCRNRAGECLPCWLFGGLLPEIGMTPVWKEK